MSAAHTRLRLEIERPADPGELVNLVQNPSGDLGAWGYLTPVVGSALRATAGPRLTYTSPGGVPSYFTTEDLPVAAGRYALAAWAAPDITGAYRASIEWVSAAGTVLSATTPTGYLTASSAVVNYGAFQAPASTAYARLRFDHFQNTAGNNPPAGTTMAVQGVALAASDTSSGLAVNRTNLLPNPSAESVSGWGSPELSPVSSVTTSPYVGTRCLRVTKTGEAGVLSIASPAVAITPGRDVAFQGRARPGSTVRTVAVEARWYDAVNTLISTVVAGQRTETAGAWTPAIGGVLTAPSNAATVRLRMRFGAKAAENEVHYADAIMIEQAGQVLGYFDGDTADAGGVTYSWSGTPHASPSTATANATLGTLTPVQWLNIRGPAREISVVREGLNAGVLTATVLDVALDPAAADTIRPGRRVRLTTDDGRNVFTGKALTASVKYELLAKDPQKRARVTLTAVDAAQTLAAAPRAEGVATIDELPYVLEGAGAPWSVNGSGDQVTTATVVATNANATAIDQVVVTRDTNLGYAWVDRNGVLQVWDRAELPSTPVMVLDETVYDRAIDIDYDLNRVINSVTVVVLREVATTGVTEEVPYGPFRDEDSIREWGLHTESYTVQGFAGDDAAVEAAASAYAAQILAANATPSVRVNSLVIEINDEEQLDRATLDLYDPVTVSNDRAGISHLARVERLEHTITTDSWLLTIGFSADGAAAPSIATASPPPGAGVIRDDLVSNELQDVFDAANEAASDAADAAANATTALTAANGKNKVTYSLSGPGSTANAAGDIWFQKESSTQTIIGQWEGLGGTSWSPKTLNNQVIANLDAGKLTAGSAFTNALTVKTNFTLGDASTDGVIQSHNFAGSPVGVFMNKDGLVAKGGQLSGTTVLGGTVRGAQLETAQSGERVVIRNDGTGGVIEFHTGLSGNPGKLDPRTIAGTPSIKLFSPTLSGQLASELSLSPGDTTTGRVFAFSGNRINATGLKADFGDVTGYVATFTGDVTGERLVTTAPDPTGAAANAYINGTGQIAKSTSSRRYKKDIKDASLSVAAVLSLTPRTYHSRNVGDDRDWIGFVAEEAHDAGLGAFVDYDADGLPDGFFYATFVAAQQIVLRDHEQRLAAQAQSITDLKAQVADLSALVKKLTGGAPRA